MDLFGCYDKDERDEEMLRKPKKSFPKPSQVFKNPERGILNTDFIKPRKGFKL